MSNTNENNKPHELDPPLGAGLPTPPDLLPMAAALAAASPAPPRIDRDRLMFLAGAASASSDVRLSTPDLRPPTSDLLLPTSDYRPPTPWHWPAATAALAATSLALATALFLRPAPPERIVYVPQPVELESTPTRDANLTSDHRPPASDLRPSTFDLRLVPPVSRPPTTVPQHNYVRSRDVALRFGLDALGTLNSASGEGAAAPTYRTLLESLGLPRLPAEASDSQQM